MTGSDSFVEGLMRYEIRSVGIWATVKVVFFLSLVFGFLLGILYAIVLVPMMSIIGPLYGMDTSMSEEVSIGGLLIILPIMFSLMSAFFNTILALMAAGLYNLIVKITGGIELELNHLAEMVQSQPYGPYAGPTYSAAPAPPPPKPASTHQPPSQYQPGPSPAAPEQSGPYHSTGSEPDAPRRFGASDEPDEDGPRQDHP